MRLPHVFRSTCLRLLLVWPCLGAAAEPGGDRLLTEAEIAGLERENAMWRLVRPGEEVAANLEQLRKAGVPAEEIAALAPRLKALWAVPFERNFGWLRPETVEQIREVDRFFITQMRAARLHEATGIRAGGEAPMPAAALERQWRRAILKVLDYDEIAEFRLMNSASARDEMRRIEGLVVSADELRTLFVWRREFEGRRIGASMPGVSLPAWQQQELLHEWRRIRDMLGDERFVIYLARAQAGFDRMRQALVRSGVSGATPALDLWWLRRGYDLMRSDRDPVVRNGNALKAEFRTKAQAMMGEESLARYTAEEEGRWLVPQTVRRVAGPPATGSSQRPPAGTITFPDHKAMP